MDIKALDIHVLAVVFFVEVDAVGDGFGGVDGAVLSGGNVVFVLERFVKSGVVGEAR